MEYGMEMLLQRITRQPARYRDLNPADKRRLSFLVKHGKAKVVHTGEYTGDHFYGPTKHRAYVSVGEVIEPRGEWGGRTLPKKGC